MSTFTTDKVACTAHKTTRTTKKTTHIYYRQIGILLPQYVLATTKFTHYNQQIYYKSTFTAKFTADKSACTKENLHLLQTMIH